MQNHSSSLFGAIRNDGVLGRCFSIFEYCVKIMRFGSFFDNYTIRIFWTGEEAVGGWKGRGVWKAIRNVKPEQHKHCDTEGQREKKID